jgi:hypothetical protein
MIVDLLFKPETVAFLLLAIVYVLGRKYIEANERRTRHISDEEYLASMATGMNCSEYDLFLVAAEKWHVSILQIEDDFKRYLIVGILPHYVRDFVRKNRSAADVEKNDKTNPGGKLPASWSA